MWTKSTMGSNAGYVKSMVHTINHIKHNDWIWIRTKQTQYQVSLSETHATAKDYIR